MPNQYPRGYAAPGTAYTSGNLFGTADISLTSELALLTLTIATSTTGIIPRLYLASTGQTIDLNEGVALTPGKLYTLSWFHHKLDAFNIRMSAACTVMMANLAEK